MQQSQSIICYQLVNAPTSLVDDIITYKSFVQRKRSSEAPCSSAATAAAAAAAPRFFSALNPVFCWVPLQGLAGGAHHHELFCPGSGASRTVPGFLFSTNWGDSLSLHNCTQSLLPSSCQSWAVLSNNDYLQVPCRWMIPHKLYYF